MPLWLLTLRIPMAVALLATLTMSTQATGSEGWLHQQLTQRLGAEHSP